MSCSVQRSSDCRLSHEDQTRSYQALSKQAPAVDGKLTCWPTTGPCHLKATCADCACYLAARMCQLSLPKHFILVARNRISHVHIVPDATSQRTESNCSHPWSQSSVFTSTPILAILSITHHGIRLSLREAMTMQTNRTPAQPYSSCRFA